MPPDGTIGPPEETYSTVTGAEAEVRVNAGSGEDAGLVEAALGGSADAFDQLYRRHRERVARAAYLVVGDAETAQDISQDAFLVAWRDLGKLRSSALFRAWVTGIALNLCRRPALLRRLREVGMEGETAVVHEGLEAGILVRRAVAGLPHRMRAVVVLRYFGQFSEPEIAEALEVPVGTVKSRLQRARTRLASALRSIDEEA
jgi:RNA polymerase sigma-70 factor, ECF subfamily